MEDKVDTKKLRKAIFAGKTFSRRPKLSLAPTEIAEKLAGFQSGTMAPICHTVDMKLFLEESIIANIDTTTHKINVGSGMFGKCLSICFDR
jgi:prolyl-tRNA editing enzyme YbaK/EbsC (Cys-tRNA(Pro) deacylase)